MPLSEGAVQISSCYDARILSCDRYQPTNCMCCVQHHLAQHIILQTASMWRGGQWIHWAKQCSKLLSLHACSDEKMSQLRPSFLLRRLLCCSWSAACFCEIYNVLQDVTRFLLICTSIHEQTQSTYSEMVPFQMVPFQMDGSVKGMIKVQGHMAASGKEWVRPQFK